MCFDLVWHMAYDWLVGLGTFFWLQGSLVPLHFFGFATIAVHLLSQLRSILSLVRNEFGQAREVS